MTRYQRETGKTWPRFVPHDRPDMLIGLAKLRCAPTWSAAHQNQYLPWLRIASRPVLGQLHMIESAIRMDLQMRETLKAWRAAA